MTALVVPPAAWQSPLASSAVAPPAISTLPFGSVVAVAPTRAVASGSFAVAGTICSVSVFELVVPLVAASLAKLVAISLKPMLLDAVLTVCGRRAVTVVFEAARSSALVKATPVALLMIGLFELLTSTSVRVAVEALMLVMVGNVIGYVPVLPAVMVVAPVVVKVTVLNVAFG